MPGLDAVGAATAEESRAADGGTPATAAGGGEAGAAGETVGAASRLLEPGLTGGVSVRAEAAGSADFDFGATGFSV